MMPPKAISGKYQRDVIKQVELEEMMKLRVEVEEFNAVFQRRTFEIEERLAAGAAVERGRLSWIDSIGRPVDRTDVAYYRRRYYRGLTGPLRKKPKPEARPKPFLVRDDSY
jgi:hypothetical protein